MNESNNKGKGGTELGKLVRALTHNWQLRNLMNGENKAAEDNFYKNMSLVEDRGNGVVIVQNEAGVKFRISGKGLTRRMTRLDD